MFTEREWETWEWEKSIVRERKNCKIMGGRKDYKIIYERAKSLFINEELL